MVPCGPVALDLPIVPLKIKQEPEISTRIITKDPVENQSKGAAQWKSDKLFQLITRLISQWGKQKQTRLKQTEEL